MWGGRSSGWCGPAARRSLAAGGRVITLIKPQYEAPAAWLREGVVEAGRLGEVLASCRRDVEGMGWAVLGEIESPIKGHGGNTEFLWLL